MLFVASGNTLHVKPLRTIIVGKCRCLFWNYNHNKWESVWQRNKETWMQVNEAALVLFILFFFYKLDKVWITQTVENLWIFCLISFLANIFGKWKQEHFWNPQQLVDIGQTETTSAHATKVKFTFTWTSFVGWRTCAAKRPFTIFASTSVKTRRTGTFIIICE